MVTISGADLCGPFEGSKESLPVRTPRSTTWPSVTGEALPVTGQIPTLAHHHIITVVGGDGRLNGFKIQFKIRFS